jgi:hypothetical protein
MSYLERRQHGIKEVIAPDSQFIQTLLAALLNGPTVLSLRGGALLGGHVKLAVVGVDVVCRLKLPGRSSIGNHGAGRTPAEVRETI